MKTLVIFDSNFGNTQRIAEVVAQELKAKAISISEFKHEDLSGVGLLIVGSPIIGWRPTEKMGKFLSSLKKDQLKGVKAASFDTRINIFFHGDATKQISAKLKGAGAILIMQPQFFYVKGKEGPLAQGELERAKKWARSLNKEI